jgi:Recombination endonuclease VII
VPISADERRRRARERERAKREAAGETYLAAERERYRRRMADPDFVAAERARGARRRADPKVQEYHREYKVTWRQANRAKVAGYSKTWRQANPGRAKEVKQNFRARNLPRIRVEDADAKMWGVHRLRPEERLAMIAAQGGLCCYCGEPLHEDRRRSVIDHDHSHCGPKHSCETCRRGIACSACNKIIGLAGEDWDRLERIAASGRDLAAAARERIAAGAVQEALPVGRDGLEAAS